MDWNDTLFSSQELRWSFSYPFPFAVPPALLCDLCLELKWINEHLAAVGEAFTFLTDVTTLGGQKLSFIVFTEGIQKVFILLDELIDDLRNIKLS